MIRFKMLFLLIYYYYYYFAITIRRKYVYNKLLFQIDNDILLFKYYYCKNIHYYEIYM